MARGSRLINGLSLTFDLGPKEGVAQGAKLHQVHLSSEQAFQRRLGAEVGLKIGPRVRLKLQQEVDVATISLEVAGTRSRTEHAQPPDPVLAANGGDAFKVGRNDGVHTGSLLTGGFESDVQHRFQWMEVES